MTSKNSKTPNRSTRTAKKKERKLNKSMRDDELIERFIVYKSSLAYYTKRNYRYLLKQLSRFLHKQKISLLDATELELSHFIGQYEYKSSKNSYKMTFNIFYKWCVRFKLREDNPIEEVPKATGKKKVFEAMKQHDFRTIQQRCQSLREISLVSCLWYTGMRSKELRFLQVDNNNLSKGFINVSNSKTTTGYRSIPIHPNFKALLERYLRKRLTLQTKEAWLFLNKFGTQIQARTLGLLIRQIQSDVSSNFTCHDFRRAFVTRLYRKTKDLVLCQRLAGHASINATRIYIIDDIEEHKRRFNALNF